MENKIDITSFESLVRAVELKADRHELNQIPQSYRQLDRSAEVDKAVQQFHNEKYDIEKRMIDMERQIAGYQRDSLG